jgi:hypothetical protein
VRSKVNRTADERARNESSFALTLLSQNTAVVRVRVRRSNRANPVAIRKRLAQLRAELHLQILAKFGGFIAGDLVE